MLSSQRLYKGGMGSCEHRTGRRWVRAVGQRTEASRGIRRNYLQVWRVHRRLLHEDQFTNNLRVVGDQITMVEVLKKMLQVVPERFRHAGCHPQFSMETMLTLDKLSLVGCTSSSSGTVAPQIRRRMLAGNFYSRKRSGARGAGRKKTGAQAISRLAVWWRRRPKRKKEAASDEAAGVMVLLVMVCRIPQQAVSSATTAKSVSIGHLDQKIQCSLI